VGGRDDEIGFKVARFQRFKVQMPEPHRVMRDGRDPGNFGTLKLVRYFHVSKKLSHYDRAGKARMVDVSAKSATRREAVASAFVAMKPAVLKALPNNPKGDPLEVARLAGIMAAKQTSNLIPMCHPLPLAHVAVDMRLCENGVAVTSRVTTTASTGVEMEALVAASIAALTVYDMCKALDKGIEIRDIVLERKSGGKSGDYARRKS
jgi:cyclic pyranopterin phosphate synthase